MTRWKSTYKVTNDLSHTVELYADVYDANFNLIPGLRVTSAEGINYRNFATSRSPVPEPGRMGLVEAALVGVAVRRRSCS